jgi:D-alanyl-D-alanine dipeptidase
LRRPFASAVLLVCAVAAQNRPGVFRIQPVRPVAELRVEALAAKPPAELGSFRKSDLVDLAALDPRIKLDIRYATPDNFLSTPVYSSARAFLQRPAAEALLRAHRELIEARLRSADFRCVPSLVCHQDVLGRHTAGQT